MTRQEYKDAITKRFYDIRCVFESNGSDEDTWAWQFLSSEVFDFTLYDTGMDKEFCRAMLDVIQCILDRTTFKYQEDPMLYRKYLLMVNMPFLAGKLDWGGSIRGAWFDYSGYPQCGGSATFEVCCGEIVVEKKDINEFMAAIIEWAKENCKQTAE